MVTSTLKCIQNVRLYVLYEQTQWNIHKIPTWHKTCSDIWCMNSKVPNLYFVCIVRTNSMDTECSIRIRMETDGTPMVPRWYPKKLKSSKESWNGMLLSCLYDVRVDRVQWYCTWNIGTFIGGYVEQFKCSSTFVPFSATFYLSIYIIYTILEHWNIII
jgi:hypothetical protein